MNDNLAPRAEEVDPAQASLGERGDTEQPGGQPAPWQYSLRGLLLLMTAASIAAAIAAARGVQSFVVSIGLFLTLFNALGYFQHWQTRAWRPRWVSVGWLVFFASLWMPAARGCGVEPVRGWQMAWVCASHNVETVVKASRSSDDQNEFQTAFRRAPLQTVLTALFLQLITVSNLLMGLTPVAWYWWRRERARWLLGLLLLGVTCAWGLAWATDANDFLYGYYVWCAGMTLVVMSQRLPWHYVALAWGVPGSLALVAWSNSAP